MTKLLRNGMVLVAVVALSLTACGKGKEKNKGGEQPKTAKPADKPTDKSPVKMTDEQLSRKIIACWKAFDAADDASFGKCYTDKSVHTMADSVPPMTATGSQAIVAATKPFRAAFPDIKHDLQLVLVNGTHSAVIFLAKGTNSGSLMGMPPTGKKVGFLGAQALTTSETGDLLTDTFYVDQSTMMGQLGFNPMPHPEAIESLAAEPTVVLAKNDDTEKANVEMVKTAFEAFNAHDAEKLASNYADDAVFKYVPDKEEVKGAPAIKDALGQYFKMTTDVACTLGDVWAAGDYVVVEGHSKGTHDGDMGEMKATNKPYEYSELHVFKIANGKVAEHWIFSNSLAFAVQVGLVDPAKMAGGGAPEKAPK